MTHSYTLTASGLNKSRDFTGQRLAIVLVVKKLHKATVEQVLAFVKKNRTMKTTSKNLKSIVAWYLTDLKAMGITRRLTIN